MSDKRTKPTPGEYARLVSEATRAGEDGRAEYLSKRFDRDYPEGES